MQFIANGPNVPEALLQAQEEDRLVLFCGAGISYPAGLPSFKGLVDEIYRKIGTTRSPIEQESYKQKWYDTTLELLGQRLQGGRLLVRKALAEALKPKPRKTKVVDTHTAILELARNHQGTMRLVTTNFDRLFEIASASAQMTIPTFAAPLLPIPKHSRWNGLVYLHGLLQDPISDSSLNNLVVSSGDFGLAYLTERWAARFVSEIFRNYVICFIGYSISDTVLRYMMDAFTADRMQGEATPEAYAFTACTPGQEAKRTEEWDAKGVTPILYNQANRHLTLHATLKAWAETWRDGILGREQVVIDYAITRPSSSTKQDDFVGRMLWALSDPSGLPAKRFADFNPVPSLEWLEALSDEHYHQPDLTRFGLSPQMNSDAKLTFSMIRRPAPYPLASRMGIVSTGAKESEWDPVMFHLARWLLRHMNDPKLIYWVVQQGGQLHPQWKLLIEQKLDHLDRLKREGEAEELNDILSQAPNAVPETTIYTLWHLLLTGRVQSPGEQLDLHRWKCCLKRDGLSVALRLELRELLTPKVALRKPFQWVTDNQPVETPRTLRQIVNWELVLASSHARSDFIELTEQYLKSALPTLFDDFQQLLRDALDLLRELGEVDDHKDRSFIDIPSISSHWQNRGFREWVLLVELLRDSWLAIRKTDPTRATSIAQAWFGLPYATYKRLAMFAASQEGCISPNQWVDWLLVDDGWWLWAINTKREIMRLLVLQGRYLEPKELARLEEAILVGPPRKMYQENIQGLEWQDIVDKHVWLMLAKLKASGVILGRVACDRLNALSNTHPNWKIAADESDEFSTWVIGPGDPGYKDYQEVDVAPRSKKQLVLWLKQTQVNRNSFYEDTWRNVCQTRFFHSLLALCDLSKEGIWPVDRWRVALQEWSKEDQKDRSWHYAAQLIHSMPDNIFLELVQTIAWWVQANSQPCNINSSILIDLCHRILDLPLNSGTGILSNGKPLDEPVTEALNHPVGQVTQVFLNLWFEGHPNDNDHLTPQFETMFTRLCDQQVERYRHGRVLLASQLIPLFRVDRTWTERHLLPLFDWNSNATEARAVWEGFLWAPRLYPPLLVAMKPYFLETAHHFTELKEHPHQFASFLTYAALNPVETYTHCDFRTAINALPQEGLHDVARALCQALEGASGQREEYWKNRVLPFWHHIWPKSRNLASRNIANSLAQLCIAAGTEFPAALSVIQDWLQPINPPDHIVDKLEGACLCRNYPVESLRLLNAVINGSTLAPTKLGKCLEAISEGDPSILKDNRFLRLKTYYMSDRL